MSHFKAFMFGVGAAFAVYYITRKDETGRSLLDELLENPKAFAKKAEAYALEDVVDVSRKVLS